MIQGPEEGWASGVAVATCSWMPDKWHWTASGPHGMTIGSADTEADAWKQGREASAGLRREMRPRGEG